MKYRFLIPSLPDSEIFDQHVKHIIARGWLSNWGMEVRALEEALCDLLNTEHAICVSSCSMGLLILLRALDLPENAEVLLPAYNFPAPAEAVLWNRCQLSYADIESHDLTMDPVDTLQRFTPKTQVIIPVHSLGNLANVSAFGQIAAEGDIHLIFDGASALGSLLMTKDAAGIGQATVISLHATKVLPAGEGGVILTNNPDLARTCRQLINYGFTENRTVNRYGFNGKMSELNAAFALAGLRGLDSHLRYRRELAAVYNDWLEKIPWLQSHANPNAVMQLFPVTLTPDLPVRLRGILRKVWEQHGIETRCYYHPPLHQMTAFKPSSSVSLPTTQEISARVICLPFHTNLTPDDIEDIMTQIQAIGVPDETR
jgi:dTDP-4-amino-4,6-dideoxygalactose transaminase